MGTGIKTFHFSTGIIGASPAAEPGDRLSKLFFGRRCTRCDEQGKEHKEYCKWFTHKIS
jgi:hypothetical protein